MKIKYLHPKNSPTPFLAKHSMSLRSLLVQGDVDPKTTSELKNV